jgi:1,4-alpha-glucan branching enzyme
MTRDRHNAALHEVITGRSCDPFAVLGPHFDPHHRSVVIRVFHPAARSIDLRIVATGELSPMGRRGVAGLFEAAVEPASDRGDPPDYRLQITFSGEHVVEIDDPYRYGRVLGDFDLHLLGEGTHDRAFEKLGAHPMSIGPAWGFILPSGLPTPRA